MPFKDPKSKELQARIDQDTQQDPGPTVFERYPIGTWQVGGSEKLAFPVVSIHEGGGNRIISRERPYRNGAKGDDTGAKPKIWTMQCLFDNSLQDKPESGILGEPGLVEVNGDKALYPQVVNELIASFDEYHEAPGDLVVPTRGKKRCRLKDYQRYEKPSEWDCASVTLIFEEDNEDRLDASSYTAPTASANANQVAETMEFSATSDLSYDENMMTLNEFAANLEGLANAPSDYANDMEQEVSIAVGAANRVSRAFSRPGVPGRDTFFDAESSTTQRKLEESKEIAYQAAYNYRKRFSVVTAVWASDQSLTSIASQLQQDLNTLIGLNPQLPDPFFIPRGTGVKVVSNGPTA
jgi:prophage DNA circulation protein